MQHPGNPFLGWKSRTPATTLSWLPGECKTKATQEKSEKATRGANSGDFFYVSWAVCGSLPWACGRPWLLVVMLCLQPVELDDARCARFSFFELEAGHQEETTNHGGSPKKDAPLCERIFSTTPRATLPTNTIRDASRCFSRARFAVERCASGQRVRGALLSDACRSLLLLGVQHNFHSNKSGKRFSFGRLIKNQSCRAMLGLAPLLAQCVCVCVMCTLILWMDEILHHVETMGNHCLLAFTEESSFQVLRWCRTSSIHSRFKFSNNPSGAVFLTHAMHS